MLKQRCSTNRHYELFSLLHVTCNKKKKKKTDQMKEAKNYMFFLLGSYHWFMYLTFLLVTVQFQVCLLRKTGQNKENFKSRRQIDNSTVIWCGHWWFIFLTKWLVKCYLGGLVNSSLKMSTEISWKCSVTFLLLTQDSVKMERGVAPAVIFMDSGLTFTRESFHWQLIISLH